MIKVIDLLRGAHIWVCNFRESRDLWHSFCGCCYSSPEDILPIAFSEGEEGKEKHWYERDTLTGCLCMTPDRDAGNEPATDVCALVQHPSILGCGHPIHCAKHTGGLPFFFFFGLIRLLIKTLKQFPLNSGATSYEEEIKDTFVA